MNYPFSESEIKSIFLPSLSGKQSNLFNKSVGKIGVINDCFTDADDISKIFQQLSELKMQDVAKPNQSLSETKIFHVAFIKDIAYSMNQSIGKFKSSLNSHDLGQVLISLPYLSRKVLILGKCTSHLDFQAKANKIYQFLF